MKHNVVVIILYDKDRRFLLQHRCAKAKLLPHYWAFFGGSIEAGETPLEAVKRETQEEISYALKAPRFVLEKDFSENGHMFVYIEKFEGSKQELQLKEGQGFDWYNKTEMRNLLMIERDRETIRAILEVLEKAEA